MIELPTCKIVGIFGPVASGKTYLIAKWAETQDRVCIFDATGEFIEKQDEYTCYFKNPHALWEHLKATPWFFRIVYAPGRELLYDFRWCLSGLWHTQSDKQFFVDEFHKICPVTATNDDIETMLRYARHDKLGFCGVSQRIADVHKLFTSGCRMVVLFHTTEARDLEAISDRWGKEVQLQVVNLRPLIHDDVSGTTSQIPQCIVIERGQQAKVFDFLTDSYVKTVGEPREDLQEHPHIEEQYEIEDEPEEVDDDATTES